MNRFFACCICVLLISWICKKESPTAPQPKPFALLDSSLYGDWFLADPQYSVHDSILIRLWSDGFYLKQWGSLIIGQEFGTWSIREKEWGGCPYTITFWYDSTIDTYLSTGNSDTLRGGLWTDYGYSINETYPNTLWIQYYPIGAYYSRSKFERR